jgi:hypothetical protein
MQRCVANGRKLDENDIAMRLLQRYCGIDGGRCAACATLGAEEREYPRFARAAEAASARGTEAGKSFEQGLDPGGMVQIFSRASTHGTYDDFSFIQVAYVSQNALRSVIPWLRSVVVIHCMPR